MPPPMMVHNASCPIGDYDSLGDLAHDARKSFDLASQGSAGIGIFDLSLKRSHVAKMGFERILQEIIEEASSTCKGVMYATSLGWTPGTGVWVLEGSKENHDTVTRLVQEHSSTPVSWNLILKLAGAEHDDTRQVMSHIPYTEDDIKAAKAKRGDNEPPIEEKYGIDPEEPNTPLLSARSNEAEGDSKDDGFPFISARSNEAMGDSEDDGFPFISGRSNNGETGNDDDSTTRH
ncbi:hypothetical protein PRK78_001711 [Emydomyces testavorans]|uniref:Uncharacterized protein n=1 Tax=Emydomyces testavorans TaxID=2070801 RepID=A0AAF0DDS4_9EURO|nr:hypothetical protein PRK78_001711 [Emydomyces testavorans]